MKFLTLHLIAQQGPPVAHEIRADAITIMRKGEHTGEECGIVTLMNGTVFNCIESIESIKEMFDENDRGFPVKN